MGCGCGKGNRHLNNTGDLKKFAYLSSRQLRKLAELEGDKDQEDQEQKEEE